MEDLLCPSAPKMATELQSPKVPVLQELVNVNMSCNRDKLTGGAKASIKTFRPRPAQEETTPDSKSAVTSKNQVRKLTRVFIKRKDY